MNIGIRAYIQQDVMFTRHIGNHHRRESMSDAHRPRKPQNMLDQVDRKKHVATWQTNNRHVQLYISSCVSTAHAQ